MPYDLEAAERVRAVFAEQAGASERKMFGGICFMLGGHMCCGLVGADLMLRLGDAGATAALVEPHVREMDFTGKVIRSMVYVEPPGCAGETDLRRWLEQAMAHARGLPPKRATAKSSGKSEESRKVRRGRDRT